MSDARRRAYSTAGRISRERIRREAPLDAEALERVQRSDIVVLPGSYDHVEWVLDALDLAYTTVGPGQLHRVTLRPEQLVVIDCPGNLPPPQIHQVKHFVAAGGSLFTTDWALRNVLEPAFPGVVEYNDRPTKDDVVRIEIADHDNPFLAGVMDDGDDPLWWLEGSSYPIRILDAERVEVLLRSNELEGKYGEAPVAITFRHGEGEVFHMISHYYLQRTELRTRRHAAKAEAYAAAKGVDVPVADIADLSWSDIESAASSARMMANLIAKKKRAQQDRER